MEIFLLYITASGKKEAQALADALLEARLAACVNIFPGVESHYRWEGKRAQAQEVVLTAKTTRDKLEAAMAKIKALHSYDTPCIVALPIISGDADFLKWVAQETRE